MDTLTAESRLCASRARVKHYFFRCILHRPLLRLATPLYQSENTDSVTVAHHLSAIGPSRNATLNANTIKMSTYLPVVEFLATITIDEP